MQHSIKECVDQYVLAFQEQEAQGPWRSAWPVAGWNQQYSFMDTCNLGEITYLQRAIYFQNLADSQKT